MASKLDEKDGFDYSSDPLDFKTPNSTLPSAETQIPRDFTITTDSYISLCSRVYAALRSTSFCEFDKIPESAFQYYAVILLWKRLARILHSSAKSGSEFFTGITNLSSDFRVPLPLLTYLKGIGHFCDPHSFRRRFVLPVFPDDEKIAGIPYTFGRVNAKTHSFYEAFPAPGIAALRMQADLRYTEDPCEENLLWDLPEGLGPDLQESHVESVTPTRNLLGWAPAQRLNVKQLEFMNLLKMDEDFMKNNYSFSNLNVRKLLGNIDDCFYNFYRNTSNEVSKLSWLPLNGSLVQAITIEKRNEFSKFDRSAMYCEGNLSVSSPYKSNETLNKGAVIAGYRIVKEPIGGRHCWSCYDFDEYKHVPESWIRSRNRISTWGSVETINETVFSTGHISKRVLQNECIKHTLQPRDWNIYL